MGARRRDRLQEALGALQLKLSTADLALIDLGQELGIGDILARRALAGVLDLTKGVAAFLVADQMSDSTTALLACGFAAPLGHSFSPFLRFRGGKGVATTVGFLFAYLPYSTGVGALILVIAYCLTRDMNKALVPGIVGMVALPPVFGAPLWVVLYVLCLFLMLAVKKAIDAPHERMVWARDPWSEGRPGFHRDEADAEAEEARSL